MTLDKQRCTASKVLTFTALFCFLLCAVNAPAQVATPAGRAQSLDVSLGYSYVNRPDSPSSRASLDGVDGSVTLRLVTQLAIKADLGYARSASGVLGAPTYNSVLNYMAGPVFYPAVGRKFDAYVQTLFGGARVSGAEHLNNGSVIGGWVAGFAWTAGGGVDYRLSDSFGLRAGVDYLRAEYFNPSSRIQGQNDVRATASLVYFGLRRRKRR